MQAGGHLGVAVESEAPVWAGMVRKATVRFWRFFLLVTVQVLQGKTMNNKILFHLASSQLCIMTSGLFNVTYPW